MLTPKVQVTTSVRLTFEEEGERGEAWGRVRSQRDHGRSPASRLVRLDMTERGGKMKEREAGCV